MLPSKMSLSERIGVLLFELIPLAIKKFFLTLKHTPFLVAFLIVSFFSTVYLFSDQFGSTRVGILVGVLACLVPALLAGIIFLFTIGYKTPEIEIKKKNLGLVFLLFYLLLVTTYGWYFHFGAKTQLLQFSEELFPNNVELAAQILGTSLNITIQFLIPFVLFVCFFKYRSKDMGLSIRFWWLGLILMCVYSCAEFVGAFLFTGTPHFNKGFLLDFVIIFFAAGFPEEFFFRGLLQPHLERLSRNKLNGVVLTSILFALIHIPARIFVFGYEPLYVIASCLSIPALGALLAGYLYLKTRSLAPGALIHAWLDVSLFAFLSMGLG